MQTDGIAKKAGWIARLDSERERDRNVARKLVQHLADALAMPIDKLRTVWEETGALGNTEAFENRLKRYYLALLRHPKKTAFLHTAFKVRYKPEIRTSAR